MPVGAVVAFPKTAVPPGFLEINGSVQSIATYPDLFAYLGTTFNTGGEGAGNFRLPESRGEFLRGWDHGRGVDTGRAVGSYQLDAFQGHWHDYWYADGGRSGTTFQDGYDVPANKKDVRGPTYARIRDAVTDGVNGTPRTASETRPRNLAVMWCIKAWNAPINQGQIDVAELVKEVQKLKAAVPVGALVPFPSGTVPPGYLEADNSLFVDSVYPELAAYLDKKYNVAGDPVGSTRLPETRGEFLRGWDHGRGIDVGRAIGSVQAQSIQKHDHAMWSGGNYASVNPTGGGAVAAWVTGTTSDYRTGNTGTDETRPRNLAVMWCIKAWNAPVNQGTIDVAGLAAQVGALEARPRGVGDGQTWQNVTASRVSGTIYTNTTGRPIQVQVSIQTGSITATCGGVTLATTGFHTAFVVPAGATYSVTLSSPVNAVWSELRT